MTLVLNADAMRRVIARMAHEIMERNERVDGLALVGLQTRGVFLSRRLADTIEQMTGKRPLTGELDISMHRDDLNLRGAPPKVGVTSVPFKVDDQTIVLTDDVIFTGRSVRAAMDALADFGRPKQIQLAVLIDRGHRELPIHADYVGKEVPTFLKDRVKVKVMERDGIDEVALTKELEKGLS